MAESSTLDSIIPPSTTTASDIFAPVEHSVVPQPAAELPTEPNIAELATTLVGALPAQLERALKHEVANSILLDQCNELAARLELVKLGIALQRDKQAQLKNMIAQARPAGVEDEKGAERVASFKTDQHPGKLAREEKENVANVSMVSEGSPVSLKSKRKGRIFPDDMRITKRVRLDPDAGN